MSNSISTPCMQAEEAVKFSAELLDSSPPSSGIYEINHVCGDHVHVFHTSVPAMQARCNSGGWTTILRRNTDVSNAVNFNRTWNEYKHGFGDLNTEFWYGLRNIHCLTNRQQVDLQIDIEHTNGSEHTYTYEHFVVDGPEDKYTLHIGQLQQPAPGLDSMAYNNRRPFSTYDEDNDVLSNINCAVHSSHGQGGGWWYGGCSHSFPTRPISNIRWYGSSSKSFEMKVRPKQCSII